MIRLASCSVQDAGTDIAVASSSSGVGVGYSFSDDPGGEDHATIPRLGGYHRFNERHRIDFSTFSFDRDGRKIIELEVDLEDETYSIGETLVYDISYGLFQVAYGFSFYRTDRLEIEEARKASFTSTEIDIQYHFNDSFVLGAGITRFSTDLTADDSDWNGRIGDSHRGLIVYGSYYL
jgi:hypothetical protein